MLYGQPHTLIAYSNEVSEINFNEAESQFGSIKLKNSPEGNNSMRYDVLYMISPKPEWLDAVKNISEDMHDIT